MFKISKDLGGTFSMLCAYDRLVLMSGHIDTRNISFNILSTE